MEEREEEFLNAADAAKLYGCSLSRIYQMAADGDLTAYRKYGRVVFLKSDVEHASATIQPRRPRGNEISDSEKEVRINS